ncbi:hypothetical protein FRB97_007180 [Tulasnella sp. 331]|nr:hypothetical protein FRB97_007180 [Tulasnella sp. 331]
MASYPINNITQTAIDPASLFYATTAQAPSPAGSSSSPSSNNSRKRPRTDYATSEERKEARAERNRVAAQVSRDRRKAEFGELRDRVNALERENAALRAASSSGAVSALFTTTSPIGTQPTISHLETEREKENRELKERVRVLENALSTLSQNVVNALQGVSGGMGALSTLLPPMTAPPTAYSAPLTTSTTQTTTSPTASTSTSTLVTASDNKEVSTRHLARVAYVSSSSLSDETSLQRTDDNTTANTSATDFPVCPTPTSANNTKTTTTINNITSYANTEDWLRAVLDTNNIASSSSSVSPPSTISTSPFMLQASSPSSIADSDLSALLHTPTFAPNDAPLVSSSAIEMSPMMMFNTASGLESMNSLFGEGEMEMEALLAMLPPQSTTTSETQSSCATTQQQEDWMSSWLKEEPASTSTTATTGLF